MPDIELNLEGLDDAVEWFRGMEKQLPFAASVALNRTADDFQAEMRNRIRAQFTLRRPDFVLRTIKRERSDFATKTKLVAMVRIDPKRDFLAKFEAGGVKRGQGNVAVPIVRQSSPALIIRRSDPLHLSKLPQGLGSGRRSRRGGVRSSFFVVEGASGRRSILQRIGGRLRTIWTFRPSVALPASLGFFSTAQRIVDARWRPNILGAIDVALRTARR